MKKYIYIVFICILVSCQDSNCFAQELRIDKIAAVSYTRADDIRYRYAVINGKVYKRLYNYTTSEWIGNWIPA